ncbi:MAG: response regulator [Spirochaetota bacterium]
MARNEKKVRIFSALEVANICGVVNQTAINWIKHGYLEAFTTPGGQYRVYSENLVEFLRSRGMRIPAELQMIAAAEERSPTVVIVDDDEELNALLRDYFGRHRASYSVLQAFDGFDAGRIVAESKPDAIILDVDLPGIDGRKLCRRIKSEAKGGKPAILAITGYSDESTRKEMLAEGADAFMAKPLDLSDVLVKVDELISETVGHGSSFA